jgi:adenylyltransferase/sulfurtransferase
MTDRYIKQRIFLGLQADTRLRSQRVAVVGLGATGSVVASWLARAGVGHLTVIDRDLVEMSNLHRQILYKEADLFKPKAEIAAMHLSEANSQIDIYTKVADLTSGNIQQLLANFDLIIDGTDNFETRFLINDYSFTTKTPWIYAGVIGGEGIVWAIAPPRTPCLRCLIEEPPLVDSVDTCNSKGVIGPAVGIVGGWASTQALKILIGEQPSEEIAYFDFWRNEWKFIKPPTTRCQFCSNQVAEFLDARWSIVASKLCGLDGVQIRVNPPGDLDLVLLSTHLESRTGTPWKPTAFSLSGQYMNLQIVIFKDGRVMMHGDITVERARSWYAEFIGC